jgi:enoyl-CoA hydratase/carnithine racemase
MADPEYFTRYQTLAMSRDEDGILLLRLRSRSGDTPANYSAQNHSDWFGAFLDIATDRDNRVVILTGTGESFLDDFAWDTPLRDAQQFDRIYFEGKHLLRRFLDIEVPIIAAVNGPVSVHPELPVLADITLASDTAFFQDKTHVVANGVPGDGVHVVWLELLGMNRGRYFLLTGQKIDAYDALALGVVNEVLPAARVLERAYELARPLARLDPLVARYTHVVLTQRLKRLLDEGVTYGLAHESLGIVDGARLRREAKLARQAESA